MLQSGESVIVTGGAGFIGSHLCELLLQRGCNVLAIDDLRSGDRANLPWSDDSLRFEELTIGSPAAAARLESHIACADFVFHLASPVGVPLAHAEPADTASSIVSAGVQLVELCRRHKRSLLFTSSSEVYGLTDAYPTTEQDSLTLSDAPRFSYATAKLVVEQMVLGLHRQYGVPSWILRLFNVAGPRQRPNAGVVAAFAQQATTDRTLLVHGDGQQTRCFLHVADAAEAIVAVASSTQLCGRAVNVGSDHSVTIEDLAAVVAAQAGRRCSVIRVGYAELFGENFHVVHKRMPDTRLVRETTGWRPQFGLHDIVRDCVAEQIALQRKSG
jgi:UDP-glucose 4-epimerase